VALVHFVMLIAGN